MFYIRKSTLVRPYHCDTRRGSVQAEVRGVLGHVGQIAGIQGSVYRAVANQVCSVVYEKKCARVVLLRPCDSDSRPRSVQGVLGHVLGQIAGIQGARIGSWRTHICSVVYKE